MPTRRAFLIQALAAALAPSVLRASAPAPAISDLWLNRLTFGATPEARARFSDLGPQAWLEEQIALPDAMAARLTAARLHMVYEAGEDGEGGTWPAMDELRPLTWLSAPPEAVLPLIDWTKPMEFAERVRPADEVIAAALIRAVHSPAQLREVMTQFWHDHFNVHAQKDEFTAVYFPAHDAALRARALGNFRDLLGAVARSGSMLCYLNNADSRASPANENFARELLELHTLGAGNYLNDRYARWHEVPQENGVAVGYIDEDVYEVARAFTGWTMGDGRYIAEGVEAPRTGAFHYAAAWHDPYQKRILGVEFPPNRADMADAEDVLDLLARHPGTARFICTKLARRLLADDPEAGLIDRLAGVFLAAVDAPDQMAQVIRALVADPAFAAPATKLRRPFEFMAALYRATGAEVTGVENDYHWQLARAGWQQHSFPPPTGHPDRAEDWQSSTTLLRLVDYALTGHDDWFGVTQTRLTVPEVATLGALAAHWAAAFGVPDDFGALFAAIGASPGDPMPEDATARHDASALAVAFAALTPAFLFR
ncbi:DUF1800 domain-containing protein [Rhodobacter sp. KR11]|uniref:DUF1800 domain-containing protein n=1 Tax=Rhodobacter sp. KR11 TaxID=2974588 RepID=UPI0022236BFD|nr:DUF1800 domain-containing protein [Rhodobacter sp. KR11]MCW1920282.1 DUF1800 domain-containing protein [Rhodobacter sp. KR11]